MWWVLQKPGGWVHCGSFFLMPNLLRATVLVNWVVLFLPREPAAKLRLSDYTGHRVRVAPAVKRRGG